MSKWTEERVEYAKRRWLEGGSGAQIAAEIGDGMTKNSIICKMFRLGFSFQGGSRDGRGNVKSAPRARVEKAAGATRRAAVAKAPKPQVIKEQRPPASRIARLVCEEPQTHEMPATEHFGPDAVHALEGGACKWPVGDPMRGDFRFCCAPQASGFVYCAHHARIAYQAPSRRSAEPAPLRRIA